MRRLLLCCLLVTFPGCSGGTEAPESTPMGLPVPEAARLIRADEAFVDPVYFEVWAASSPTAARLKELGYLAIHGGQMELTPRSVRMGVREDRFQDDIPVFYFPVGRRALVDIASVEGAPMEAASQRVEFRYRREPTELGRELIEGGSRLDELKAERVLPGLAFLTPGDAGWSVTLIEL